MGKVELEENTLNGKRKQLYKRLVDSNPAIADISLDLKS